MIAKYYKPFSRGIMRQKMLMTMAVGAMLTASAFEMPGPDASAPLNPGEIKFPICIIDGKAYVTYSDMVQEYDNDALPVGDMYPQSAFEECTNNVLVDTEVVCQDAKHRISGLAPYAVSNNYVIWFISAMPLERIMGGAFHDSRANYISLECDVDRIDDGAFVGCNNLRCILMGGFGGINRQHFNDENLMSRVPQLESLDAFDAEQLESVCVVVPEKLYEQFKQDEHWGQIPGLMTEREFISLYVPATGEKLSAWQTEDKNAYLLNDGEASLTSFGANEWACANTMPRRYCEYTGDFEVATTVTWEGNVYPVTGIAPYAFFNSTVTSIKMHDNIKVVSRLAATHSRQLETVKMGAGVERIGSRAFMDCPKLSRVEVRAALPPTFDDNSAFLLTSLSDVTLVVPDDSYELYRQAPVWCDFGYTVKHSDIYGSVADVATSETEVRAADGCIVLANVPAGDKVNVYGVDGRYVASVAAGADGSAVVRVSPGVYIVTVGTVSAKVVVD